jgi:hypothetical protein
MTTLQQGAFGEGRRAHGIHEDELERNEGYLAAGEDDDLQRRSKGHEGEAREKFMSECLKK